MLRIDKFDLAVEVDDFNTVGACFQNAAIKQFTGPQRSLSCSVVGDISCNADDPGDRFILNQRYFDCLKQSLVSANRNYLFDRPWLAGDRKSTRLNSSH